MSSLGAITTPAAHATGSPSAGVSRECVYTGHSIDRLRRYSSLVQRAVSCAVVFNDAAPSWREWHEAWFVGQAAGSDLDWAGWARADSGRQLVVTQSMVPTSELRKPWRDRGARGRYDRPYRLLARRLVAAGLGRAVIRLGAEANDPGSPNWVGATARSKRAWRRFWRRAATVMRSVPGAAFTFDWCINAHWRPLALASFYPGDLAVDVVGIDAYDDAASVGEERWREIRDRPDGLADVAAFAAARGKPVSVPEWGIAATGRGGIGDDPAYVQQMLRWLRAQPVVYDAYFYSGEFAAVLDAAPRSQAVLAGRVA